MRILSRTVALVALSGCMSNNARVESNSTTASEQAPIAGSPSVETANLSPSTAQEAASPVTVAGTASVIEAEPTPEATPEKTPCDALKKDVALPYFLKETSTLVIGLDQKCKESGTASNVPAVLANMSVVGVACTGAPGLITRRGHSNQNWELVSFGMDLGCNMRSPEEVKILGKKSLGIPTEPHIISFVPMMIEYWEFEKNNDAGLSSTPTLTASGGGAAQWKKNETKSTGFPIKLYGHSSTIGKDQSVYEARAVLLPRSNQRQFEVLVQEMKLLNPDELKVTLDRCLAKTKSSNGCNEAFDNQ